MGNCVEVEAHDTSYLTDFLCERITRQCNGECFHCNCKIFRLMQIHLSNNLSNSYISVTCYNCENVSKFYAGIKFTLKETRNNIELVNFIIVEIVLEKFFRNE